MRSRRRQAGFTMIEVMISVLLTAIAMIGVVGLYRVQSKSSNYSRRSTEASVLAADKMETLRSVAIPVGGSETGGDARGVFGIGGPYTRTWTVATVGTDYRLQVAVSWDDDGTKTVTMYSLRGP